MAAAGGERPTAIKPISIHIPERFRDLLQADFDPSVLLASYHLQLLDLLWRG